mmetsp:Transcript_13357/g.22192  ORF Transcript_13357/g.22192 Transcript_13357/m.22192 type:complete len:426 (+) Transcript_13357:192-1469(+)
MKFQTLPLLAPLLYVDPIDSDLTNECSSRGVPVLAVWSQAYLRVPRAQRQMPTVRTDVARAPGDGEEASWAAKRLNGGISFASVICGSEAGLSCAERLQHSLVPTRSNGLCVARRDKMLMNQMLSLNGLLTAAHVSPSDWPEAERFIRALPDQRVVLKPRRGTGSAGVTLTCDLVHARRAFNALKAPFVSDDEVTTAPLVMEFLDGEEWVVDTVSRNGEHKAVALWRYSKGFANSAPFVYFYDEIMPATGEPEKELIQYAFDALDALHWRWGPCHIELKRTSRGPALIEVNAGRCNGVRFAILTNPCIGYSAYDAIFAAYYDEAKWVALPPVPPSTLCASGRLVKLVSTAQGRLKSLNDTAAEEIRVLPSVVSFDPKYTKPGQRVRLTVDLLSAAGYCTLLHQNPDVVDRDYQMIAQLQRSLFIV